MDAALELRRRGVRARDVATVRVGTFRTALEVTSIRDPQSPYQAKFSLPFCVALALSRGRVGLAEFTPASLADPELRALADRVALAEDPACNRAFPARWQAAVTVGLATGRRETVRVEAPRGSPENPASDGELREKFDGLCEGRIPPARRDALRRAVDALHGMDDVAAAAWGADADGRQ